MVTLTHTDDPIERAVNHAEVIRLAGRTFVPAAYILGAFLFWSAAGVWWPWQAAGVLLWIAATIVVFGLSDTVAEYRKRKARGEVMPR
jgi:hypothetical protein